MKNLDTIKSEFQADFIEALNSDDKEAVATALTSFAQSVQESVITEAKEVVEEDVDKAALAARGVRVLTSEETKYYSTVMGAMRSNNPKSAITMIDDVMPATIIDRVFEDITEAHPLLDAIRFENTGAIVQMILGNSGGVAGWGELCDEITDELEGGFEVIELTLKKLSAYIPVCNAMLDLGPTWLDRYVRTILAEALAVGLEAGIVDGDGKDKPRGMSRMLSGDTGGVFPRKAATAITDFSPETIGNILATVAESPSGKMRVVPNLLLVVNPKDYYTKVFPATTIMGTDGTYRHDVMPYPMTVVQSAAVPEGFAVAGLAPKYFMGIGTAKGGKLEYSDEYKFLEDLRMYRIKLYGNGTALDENAFVYLDISAIEPANVKVKVVS